jgi:hypothetical protein
MGEGQGSSPWGVHARVFSDVIDAGEAQSAEHRFCEPRGVGSTPTASFARVCSEARVPGLWPGDPGPCVWAVRGLLLTSDYHS